MISSVGIFIKYSEARHCAVLFLSPENKYCLINGKMCYHLCILHVVKEMRVLFLLKGVKHL